MIEIARLPADDRRELFSDSIKIVQSKDAMYT